MPLSLPNLLIQEDLCYVGAMVRLGIGYGDAIIRRGQGGAGKFPWLPDSLTGAFEGERVAGLAVEGYLAAWRDVLRHETPAFGVEGMVEGLLRWGIDVPELLAAVTCPLTAVAPLDGLLRPLPAEAVSGK